MKQERIRKSTEGKGKKVGQEEKREAIGHAISSLFISTFALSEQGVLRPG